MTVDDGSDTCVLRFFNFYPSQQKTLAVGARVRVRGELKGGFLGWTMMHPSHHTAGGALPQALTPVYPTVAGLPQPYLRRAVQSGLARADLSDTIPADFLNEIGLEPPVEFAKVRYCFCTIRRRPRVAVATGRPQPPGLAAAQGRRAAGAAALAAGGQARPRPAACAAARAQTGARGRSSAAPGRARLHEQLLAALPFQLTAAQRRVSEEIARDLARPVPMHRLLQGDVGSGKTVVAALAATLAIDAGWQCALMAPTEILAEQHFRKLIGWLDPLLAARGQRVAWLTGSQKKKERGEMLALIASGEAALVVGTHAVIQEQVQFKSLALAIIDEQHRFGVAQRLALAKQDDARRPARECQPGTPRNRLGRAAKVPPP